MSKSVPKKKTPSVYQIASYYAEKFCSETDTHFYFTLRDLICKAIEKDRCIRRVPAKGRGKK